ncbi:hypothetical protein FQR65_LT19702 [Abscondita terminalis]|nr:hypothetical protein FQR65_LT19702 [Abscondita terminalis]
MDLLTVAKTRYTTKAYDATKKIPQEQFERLVEILRLTPSSINIQPWHFFIADHDEAKQRIAKALVDEKAKQGQKESRSGYVSYYRNEKGDIQRWAENQTFIALGQMLLAAGIEGIDATPIGGFDEAILTEELGLTEKNLIPSVIMTLGYRSDVDFNAKLPKSRLAQKDVITRL